MPQKARHAAPPVPPEFFTIEETAARLRLSRRLVYDLVKKRVLPAHRMAGSDCIRVNSDDLAKYVERSRLAEN